MKQNTAQQILDVAQSMVRNRGYSAFSYADIAKEIGIRKASIHYHFPSKEDLVKQLVIRYRDNLVRQCQAIEIQKDTPQEQLKKFVSLYRNGLLTLPRINYGGFLLHRDLLRPFPFRGLDGAPHRHMRSGIL